MSRNSEIPSAVKVLPESLINKIAAGEVIDRPSSVVKELVENAIDAGASRILVAVKKGGHTLIQVSDNGRGMNERDAIMSIQRHATSKISELRDIERITTLGFRGEALSSMAAVSQMEIKSLERGTSEGTVLSVEGGTVQRLSHSGGEPGTSVAVKNLFYNTPARRKFLRAPSTEYRHILAVLNRFTLAYPEIEFSTFHEGKLIYNLKPSDLRSRVCEVFGRGLEDHLIELVDDNALVRVSGYIGGNELLRRSRSDQYVFVNRRYINDRTISAAVLSAYGEVIPKGAYPLYLILLEIDPERVDVNVHPTKSEVKFADAHMVFTLVRGAVKRALSRTGPEPEIKGERPSFLSGSGGQHHDFSPLRVQQLPIDFDTVPAPSPALAKARSEPAPVWQVHNKYILSQIKSGMVIVDQHAAHERILYEGARAGLHSREAEVQQLLFPQTLDLSAGDHQLLLELMPHLKGIGFDLKEFGARAFVLEGVPAGVSLRDESRLLEEILEEYKANPWSEKDVQERVLKSYACRSAIKSGTALSPDEMNALIAQLFSLENPYYCPHGRPVIITLTTDELDRRFERK